MSSTEEDNSNLHMPTFNTPSSSEVASSGSSIKPLLPEVEPPEKNGNDFILKDIIHILNLLLTIISAVILVYSESKKNNNLVIQ